jgi:F0F1-type ATP synthase assembly protein I
VFGVGTLRAGRLQVAVPTGCVYWCFLGMQVSCFCCYFKALGTYVVGVLSIFLPKCEACFCLFLQSNVSLDGYWYGSLCFGRCRVVCFCFLLIVLLGFDCNWFWKE